MASSGGQPGNKNAVRGRQAAHALEIALANNGEEVNVVRKMKCLVEIWQQQITLAKAGDPAAVKMIVERLDGKPGQTIDLGAEVSVTFNLDYGGKDAKS